jgi:hypothetical protein
MIRRECKEAIYHRLHPFGVAVTGHRSGGIQCR